MKYSPTILTNFFHIVPESFFSCLNLSPHCSFSAFMSHNFYLQTVNKDVAASKVKLPNDSWLLTHEKHLELIV